ncbi:MAG: winged helix-turn-helix domain-containing protein [Planctomycetota bacterium]
MPERASRVLAQGAAGYHRRVVQADDRPAPRVVFGTFEFDPQAGELRRGGARVSLPPQPARLLGLLLRHPGELVTRERIRSELWDGVVVDFDQGVHTAMRQIRQALGDRAAGARYVETLPRRGYRFIAPVRVVGEASERWAEPPEDTPPVPARRRWPAFAAVLAGALALTALLLLDRRAPEARPPAGPIRLAVLPFEPAGAEEAAYFADGLTEATIFHLGRLHPERLRVLARSSVTGFAGADAPVRELGERLGAHYLLEARVRLRDGRVRVHASLVQVADETRLWSDTLEHALADVDALQARLAARLAESLTLELLHPPRAGRRSTSDPMAYDAYLRARSAWNRFTPESIAECVELYRAAVELDPGFGLAWAHLAEAYALVPFYGVPDVELAFAKAAETAEHALLVDDGLAPAWNALGFAELYGSWDWKAADRAFARAVQLDPGYAMAHHWYAGLLSAVERHDEAIAELELAVELDPLSLSVRSDLAWYYLFADRYGRGVEVARDALSLEPYHGWSRAALVLGAHLAGDDEEARAALLAGRRQQGAAESELAALGALAPRAAVRSAWRRTLPAEDDLEGVDAYGTAAGFALVGELETALRLLERAVAERHPWVVFLLVDPRFDALHDDPRWERLVAGVGLPR